MSYVKFTHPDAPPDRNIGLWLISCCIMVSFMVLVGGLTRLTESGLSITEWAPLHGAIPPLHEKEWLEEFDNYQKSPEYIHKNHGMSLDAFKRIFWWEYGHRLLGRVTGLVFLLPLIWFIVQKRLKHRQSIKLLGIFALGGLQGAVGWFMVKSGLVDTPMVSPIRLALHLLLALTIFTLLLREALLFLNLSTTQLEQQHRITKLRHCLAVLVTFQILLGALVAGNDAGLVYNSFPDMNGAWFPSEAFAMAPWWHNLIENHALVQWMHRAGAWLLLLFTLLHWFFSRSLWHLPQVALYSSALLSLILMQFVLGVSTLLLAVPVGLASLHQMMALLIIAVLTAYYRVVQPCKAP